MLTFKSAFAKNFLAIGKTGITYNLSDVEKTLIIGRNGQGKSTLTDILNFALYGKPFRKINKPDLVNNLNKKNLEVRLLFEKNGIEYTVVRGISPAKFEIWKGDKIIDQDASTKEYQKRLESIIGWSEKTSKQIIMLGSSSYVPFMRLTTGERREVVENILDIEVYSYMSNITKNRLSVINDQYNDLNNKIKITENSIEHKKDHLNDVQEEKNNRIEELNNKREEIKNKIEEIDRHIKSLSELHDSLHNQLNNFPPVKDTLKKLKEYKTKIEHNKEQLNNSLNFYDNDYCPTCEQDLSKELVNKKKQDINENIQKIDDALESLYSNIDKNERIYEEINEILEKLNNVQNDVKAYESEKKLFHNQLDSYNKEIYEIENNTTRVNEDDILKLEGELNSLKEQRNKVIQNKNHLNRLNEMLKDDGIKQKIIKNYIPIINNLMMNFLNILDFHVQFSFNKEFKETIKINGREYDYFGLSDGQKLRVDLCVLFTWRELARMRGGMDTNLIVFDEVGSNSLDPDGFEAFMTLIDKVGGNKFIIGPSLEDITDKFDKVLNAQLDTTGFTEVNVVE